MHRLQNCLTKLQYVKVTLLVELTLSHFESFEGNFLIFCFNININFTFSLFVSLTQAMQH